MLVAKASGSPSNGMAAVSQQVANEVQKNRYVCGPYGSWCPGPYWPPYLTGAAYWWGHRCWAWHRWGVGIGLAPSPNFFFHFARVPGGADSGIKPAAQRVIVTARFVNPARWQQGLALCADPLRAAADAVVDMDDEIAGGKARHLFESIRPAEARSSIDSLQRRLAQAATSPRPAATPTAAAASTTSPSASAPRAASATPPRRFYAGIKSSLLVKDVEGRQADVGNFFLTKEKFVMRCCILRRHIHRRSGS
jgi:hypothetical protein